MPITREQFELGIDSRIESQMREIHSFLAKHRDEAFTLTELGRACGVRVKEGFEGPIWAEEPAFVEAVKKLVELGAVELRPVKKDWYYAWRAPLEI